MVNKRGWIKLVEAFFALMLVAGVLLFLFTEVFVTEGGGGEIYEWEIAMLREISFNDSLREAVVSVSSEELPVRWENFSGDLEQVKNSINKLTPGYLVCEAMVCEVESLCVLEDDLNGKSIYTKSKIIAIGQGDYSPKKFKIFCWED